MDDRLRETLSAMLDDEADELSVRRLLSHGDQNEVRSQWQRWQQVRDLMHDGSQPVAGGINVSEQVRQSLDSSIPQQLRQASGAGGRGVWRWSAAAMVTFGLLVGFGVGSGWEQMEPAVVAASAQPPAADENPVPEVALQGLDDEQWEQLSRYLLEHAQHNSVGAGRGSVGYARLASASAPAY